VLNQIVKDFNTKLNKFKS